MTSRNSVKTTFTPTVHSSLKTPISKALLTPGRRIGLSKPKKALKVLNLNLPSPVGKDLGCSEDVGSKKTPLKNAKDKDLDASDNVMTPSMSPVKIQMTSTVHSSLKTPISKALLTPGRRIGLSKPKKHLKVSNLNLQSSVSKDIRCSNAIESKKTPLKNSKDKDLDASDNITPTVHSSLKTPISKTLLTPGRRIGLSKPKKALKVLNLDLPSPIGKDLGCSNAVESKKTPLKNSKDKVLDISKPVDSKKTSMKASEARKTTWKAPETLVTPSFSRKALDELNNDHLARTLELEKTSNTKKIELDRESPHVDNEPTKATELHIVDKANKGCEKEEKTPTQQNKIKPQVVQILQNTIKKAVICEMNTMIDKAVDIEIETKPKDIPEIEKTVNNNGKIKDFNKKTDKTEKRPIILKKLPLFRKETTTNKTNKNVENSPVRLGKFTTSDWLEDEEFRGLRDRKFDWKVNTEEKDNINSSSDSEKEMFCSKNTRKAVVTKRKINEKTIKTQTLEKDENISRSDSDKDLFTIENGRKTDKKRKRKVVKMIDSSSDDMEPRNSGNMAKNTKEVSSSGNLVVESSDEEFSKEPKKIRKKSSKKSNNRTKSLDKNKSTEKILKNSKKLKQEVKITVEKLSEEDVGKYSKNYEKIINTSQKINENVEEKVDITVDREKEKQQLLEKVKAMRDLIAKKEEHLTNLKQAQIYMEKHDPEKLKELSNVWLNGCRLAISDLLQLLKQHGPITMKSLLVKLQIAPEILEKLKIPEYSEED